MFLNDRTRLLKETKRLQSDIDALQADHKRFQSEADELALEAEIDASIRLQRDKLEQKSINAARAVRQKQLALTQAKAHIAEIDATEREKERVKHLDKLVDQGRSTLAAYTDLHIFAGEFEKRRAIAESEAKKLKDIAYQTGVGASVASLIKEARGRTLRWIMMAAAPEAARDLGLTQNLGKSRGHCGLLTTLQNTDFNEWRKIKTDAQIRAEKQAENK